MDAVTLVQNNDYLETGVNLRENLLQIQEGKAEEWLQESLASTYRVRVPVEKGLTNHLYRVLR